MKTIKLNVASIEVFFEMFEKMLMDEKINCNSNYSIPSFDVTEFKKSKKS